jgi:hypothetical protein
MSFLADTSVVTGGPRVMSTFADEAAGAAEEEDEADAANGTAAAGDATFAFALISGFDAFEAGEGLDAALDCFLLELLSFFAGLGFALEPDEGAAARDFLAGGLSSSSL